jgi:Zn-dependent protease with chaperone function
MSTDPGAPPAPLAATWFDGRSPQPHAVQLRIEGDSLVIEAEALQQRLPLGDIRWPERQRHGPRIVELANGGSLHCSDGAAWDHLAARAGHTESAVVRLQQSWRAALAALAVLVVVSTVTYVWGIPLAARGVVALLPPSVDARIGSAALSSLDDHAFKPSRLPAAEQERLRRLLNKAIERDRPADGSAAATTPTLHFRDLGADPNALALPGGHVVISDALVALAHERDDILIGVLGHEVGHVQQRHGMRMVVQATLISAASTLVLGDISGLLAAAPALLGQLAYSRDFEREADVECLRLLRANGLDGTVMVAFFERLNARLQQQRGEGETAALLSSHPVHAERIAFFREGR